MRLGIGTSLFVPFARLSRLLFASMSSHCEQGTVDTCNVLTLMEFKSSKSLSVVAVYKFENIII